MKGSHKYYENNRNLTKGIIGVRDGNCNSNRVIRIGFSKVTFEKMI